MELSLEQQRMLGIIPKPSSIISFFASASLVYRLHHEKRKRPFHRIVLTMSCHWLVQSVVFFWGTSAFPEIDSIDIYGAKGSFTACTIQGFLSYTNLAAIALHYASLSIYSYLAVLHDFQQHKFAWVEKWIYAAIYVYVFAAASFLASLNMFNPAGPICWIQSFPQGCDLNADIECTRGVAERKTPTFVAVVGIYFVVVIGITTSMMIAMYILTRSREVDAQKLTGKQKYIGSARAKKSRKVLKRAGAYMVSFYAALAPGIFGRVENIITGTLCFPLLAASSVTIPLQGFFLFIVYYGLYRNHKVGKKLERRLSLQFARKKSPKCNISGKKTNSCDDELNPKSSSIFDGSGPVSEVWKEFIFEDDASYTESNKNECGTAGNLNDIVLDIGTNE